MLSKQSVKKVQSTLEYMLISFIKEDNAKISVDIDFGSYKNEKGEYKCDEYNFEVTINTPCDPDIEEVYRIVKLFDNKTTLFFKSYNITEDFKIVSQKQYPNKSFEFLISGALLPSLKFTFLDEELVFTLSFMIETLQVS